MDKLNDLMLQFEAMIEKEEKRHITDDDRRDQMLTTLNAIEEARAVGELEQVRLLYASLDFDYMRRLAGLVAMRRIK